MHVKSHFHTANCVVVVCVQLLHTGLMCDLLKFK